MPNLGQATSSQSAFLNRDYSSIRQEIIVLLSTYYPDQFQDFNIPSIGSSLIDLLAFVNDSLSFNIDKKFNDLFLDTVTSKSAVYRLANNLGYQVPGIRAAISLADFTINVPVTATGPDQTYLPVYRAGLNLAGGGQVFETIFDMDFSSDFSAEGTANRLIIPIVNGNQDITSYQITKREIIEAGTTVFYSQQVSQADASTPFFQITLPESTVLNIISVICIPGANQSNVIPTFEQFSDPKLRYYQVDELAESQIFMNDDTVTGINGIQAGKLVTVTNRFISRFTPTGQCVLTFGGGTPSNDAYQTYLSQIKFGQEGQVTVGIQNTFDNMALGSMLQPNSTVWIKYSICPSGGNSNVASNVLNQVSNIDAVILGSDPTQNQAVIASTSGNNVLAAIGGAGLPTVQEIVQNISSNFAAQNRCITLDDYLSRVSQIPGQFGTPFRTYGKVEDNKVKLYILTLNGTGQVMTTSTSIIKNNIVNYLAAYRSLNDFVEINDGKVLDIQIEVDILIDKTYNSNEVLVSALNAVSNYFDITTWQMNQNLYASNIITKINEVSGVMNVSDLRIYNIYGGNYSSTLSAQATGNMNNVSAGTNRIEVELINNTLFSSPTAIIEVRYPNVDIKIRSIT